MLRVMTLTLTLGATLALGACANNDSFLSLGQDTTPPSTAALPPKPAVDPACNALAARIEALRQDGVVDRLEAAAAKGKGGSVSVKRASLSQVADLEKANAEFQAKCSTVPRAAQAASPVPAPQAAAQAPQKTAALATKPAAKKVTAKAKNAAEAIADTAGEKKE